MTKTILAHDEAEAWKTQKLVSLMPDEWLSGTQAATIAGLKGRQWLAIWKTRFPIRSIHNPWNKSVTLYSKTDCLKLKAFIADYQRK